ncbi:sporulation domain protein [Luminiphilus syltensis NOR5-1B]|uniref:Sporulation domain protein n=1 Tax=Luminiphilus syltensis NOR5-1B TaxID=565045 RepID=B8KYE0_9GAMM|nr:SPOR domain-containing protein [Luminiphilus syltensis]EED35260.1 sporulation domain protein [Luminiphilus syltensis NOR5-1B]
MDPILKQRLVGALVLIALGVVFWPIIFVQPERFENDPIALEPIPPAPTIDRSPMPEPENRRDSIAPQLPQLPDLDQEQIAADEATSIDETLATQASEDLLPSADEVDPPAPRERAPQPPAVDEQGLAMAWVLQVATLSSESRANELVDRLTTKGYPAFVRSTSKAGRQLYRVQIGPKIERDKLAPIKTVIDPLLKVDSAVIRYIQ